VASVSRASERQVLSCRLSENSVSCQPAEH
jgi:hypothetical protein